jgi:hypothetical protein
LTDNRSQRPMGHSNTPQSDVLHPSLEAESS